MRLGRLYVLLGVAACGDNLAPSLHVSGSAFSDDNGNGIRDPDEAGFADITVFINLDDDPTISGFDPVTKTDADGNYTLEVPGPGTYSVQEVLPFGVRARAPQSKRKKLLGLPHIIGGNDTSAGDYGFMVAVGQPFEDILFQFCGGALITDRHVITAAHCSQGVSPSEVAIAAGTLDPFEGGDIVGVERITIHPAFLDVDRGDDIAIWTLKDPIDLEASNLFTVELASAETTALEQSGTLATTIGWGVSDRVSSLLQQVHVPIVDADECAAAYPESTNFGTQICAGSPLGGIDSCQGDSGGPLVVRDDARQVWIQAGITSYGEGCALPGFPGIYARVSALSEWALAQARETSEPVAVVVAQGEDSILDFPNESAVRPQVGAINARWQLTGSTLPSQVAPNEAVELHWEIIGDGSPLTGFTCSFEGDLAAATPAQTVACELGDTEVSVPGFATGIFATSLTVTRDDVEFRRNVNVISGTPARTQTTGALEAQDPLDPDFTFAPFHLDYFDVSGLSGTKAFAIEATTNEFTMFLTVYDAAERDFANGGGAIGFGEFIDDDTQRIIIVPEAGKTYLVGVSSFEEAALGTYQISIVNDGTIAPH